jgi:hypothetical protein
MYIARKIETHASCSIDSSEDCVAYDVIPRNVKEQKNNFTHVRARAHTHTHTHTHTYKDLLLFT